MIPHDEYVRFKFNLFDQLGYQIFHPEVKRFHMSDAKVKVVAAARRTTKSFSAAHDIMPDCLLPDKRLWIVGPNYGLAEKEFHYIHKALVLDGKKRGIPKPSVAHVRAGQLYIRWPWGTILEGKSAERPESLLGEAVDKVIYSEAAQLKKSIREKYVEPTLMTKKGKEILPTTPEEGAEWVHNLFISGQEHKHGVESFEWDGKANPLYDWDHYNRMKEFHGEDSPIFREQYMGKWEFYGGRVYPHFSEDVHVIPPFDIPKEWPKFRGIDFGHRDPFVCLWMAVGPERELYFYREFWRQEGVTREHAQEIMSWNEKAPQNRPERIRCTYADPSAAQLIEDLSYDGVRGLIPANNDREAGRVMVSNFLLPIPNGPRAPSGPELEKAPNMYFFDTMKETIRELKYYRWKEGRAVQGDKEKTEGNDHCCDVLRYLAMSRPAPFKTKPQLVPGSFDHAVAMAKVRNNTGVYVGR